VFLTCLYNSWNCRSCCCGCLCKTVNALPVRNTFLPLDLTAVLLLAILHIKPRWSFLISNPIGSIIKLSVAAPYKRRDSGPRWFINMSRTWSGFDNSTGGGEISRVPSSPFLRLVVWLIIRWFVMQLRGGLGKKIILDCSQWLLDFPAICVLAGGGRQRDCSVT